LGTGLHRFGPDKLKDLINLRLKLGMPDPRAGLKECELCDNSELRSAGASQMSATPRRSRRTCSGRQYRGIGAEITEEILRQLSSK